MLDMSGWAWKLAGLVLFLIETALIMYLIVESERGSRDE